ncbi:MAG TPA: ABC transporter substrate-binding protein [Gemmatimonadaceae bacterium]|nr:ABC transporter substrate-binding protein [Gemmatimonadaceae bacterium]
MYHHDGQRRGPSPLLLLLALAAAGCASERARRDPATLVAAIGSDPGQLNPAITTNGGVHTAAGLLYDGLVALDDSLRPTPALAERWEIENGGARYRFHLRRGVRWHDGKPFSARDVKFTFDKLLLLYHARTRASMAPALSSVDAVDDSTVVFTFRRAYAPLLQQLDVSEAPILPEHVYAGSDPLRNPANIAPIGTGPYRFASYTPHSEIRYTANRDYFRGPPSLGTVVLRIIPDNDTQVAALEAGEVDWLYGVPGPARQRLSTDPRIRIIHSAVSAGGSNCISTLGFNLDRPWFRDVRVRKAIAHAINRPQFVERVLFGDGRVADAPISSGIAFAHAGDLPIPAYDTVEAMRLFEAAGWQQHGSDVRTAHAVRGVADGTSFTIGFKGLPGQMVYGDLLRAQLRSVGIDLRLEPLEQGVFTQAVFTARDFDTAIGSYCNGTDPEIGVRRMYVSSSVAPVPFSNMAGYRNPAMDTLFDRAGAALDLNERRQLYHQIQEIAVRDQPYVWLVETVSTQAYSVRCHGFGNVSHFAATAACTR